MPESFIPTAGGVKLQSWANDRDGNTVHSEGTVSTDVNGDPIDFATMIAGVVAIFTRLGDGSTRVAPTPSAATRTSVAGAAADTPLLAANAGRKGALIYNDSNSILYIGLGATPVSDSDFTFPIAADAAWEVPPGFTGEVRGIWVDAGGFARITELA